MPNLVNCPHCGKEMYEMLTTCPHCGGPVVSEAVEKAVEKDIDELYRAELKSEWLWLICSFAAGAFVAFLMSSTPTEDNGLKVVMMVLMFYGGASMAYGAHSIHWFRKGLNFGIIVGLLSGYFGLVAGGFAGMVFYLPRAIIRIVRRKPLITREEFEKQL